LNFGLHSIDDTRVAHAYQQHMPASAINFIFSKVFSTALQKEASKARVYGVSAEDAIEEFRRLLMIKVFTADVDATKISPSPISRLQRHPLCICILTRESGRDVACRGS
jgi:hypothetical protein